MMQKIVKDNESLEDLGNSLWLIQKKNGFRFGTDAVLLADFAKGIPAKNALDLCSGSGIVPILLSKEGHFEKIFGLEIQEDIHDASRRSIAINLLENKVEFILGDLKNVTDFFPKRNFSLVTCNPPYMKGGAGIECEDYSKHIARHEVLCNLEDVIKSAESMLSVGGHFCMVHRPSRLSDIMYLMRKYKIEPKRLRLVLPKKDKEPTLILIDGLFHGGSELKILPPLILYNDDGTQSDELKEIYGKD